MRIVKTLAVVALLALVSPVQRATPQTARESRGASLSVSAAAAPPGMETVAAEWVNVAAPGLGVMPAAIARPSGAGPFPVIVLLHGSDGFAQEYVRLAQDLSGGGLLAVAACWFQGGDGAGARFVTPIACPDAAAMPGATSSDAIQTVDTLLKAARGLPGVRADRVALFGHSRGGGAVLSYVLRQGGVQAAILNSAGYPSEFAERAAQVKGPILMLHGTADNPADGGGALSNVQMARDFESALLTARKPVEAVYYEGGRHNGLFTSAAQYRDEVQRMVAFLQRHLRN